MSPSRQCRRRGRRRRNRKRPTAVEPQGAGAHFPEPIATTEHENEQRQDEGRRLRPVEARRGPRLRRHDEEVAECGQAAQREGSEHEVEPAVTGPIFRLPDSRIAALSAYSAAGFLALRSRSARARTASCSSSSVARYESGSATAAASISSSDIRSMRDQSTLASSAAISTCVQVRLVGTTLFPAGPDVNSSSYPPAPSA